MNLKSILAQLHLLITPPAPRAAAPKGRPVVIAPLAGSGNQVIRPPQPQSAKENPVSIESKIVGLFDDTVAFIEGAAPTAAAQLLAEAKAAISTAETASKAVITAAADAIVTDVLGKIPGLSGATPEALLMLNQVIAGLTAKLPA